MAAFDPLPFVQARFAERGEDVWLVGGRVRDGLLGRPTVDTDVVVRAGALDHARALAARHGAAFVPLDARRGIARVVWAPERPGLPPRAVLDISDAVHGRLHDDLRARDFTVNALAIPLAALTRTEGPRGPRIRPADVVDVTGGRADLVARRLRMVSAGAFVADPLRMLRGVRLAAQLGFDIEQGTAAAISQNAAALAMPAAERRRDELMRLLVQDPPEWHVERLSELSLLPAVLPVLAGAATRPARAGGGSALAWSMRVLDAIARMEATLADSSVPPPSAALQLVTGRHRGALTRFLAGGLSGGYPRSSWLRLAALLAENGESSTDHHAAHALCMSSDAASLRLGHSESQEISVALGHAHQLVRWATSTGPDRRQLHRYFRSAGEAGVSAVLLGLAFDAADHPASQATAIAAQLAVVADRVLDAWFERHAQIVSPPLLLDGRTIMARFELAPGPRIGALIRDLREAQASGEIRDSEQAYQWVLEAVRIGGS